MDWPKLEYAEWLPTYRTLHRWLQIVGKIRLCHEPWTNHSWYSALYVTSRGLTTSAIPEGRGCFSAEFDFLRHRLGFRHSDGREILLPLKNEPVASFYGRVMDALDALGIRVSFDPRPNEVADATPFSEDTAHAHYVPDQANACWLALVGAQNILKRFRSSFIGKCSPVHFFWGSFDLAVTRFSGRRAPDHPGGVPHLPDRVAREAYSHEVSSCGFWPGNEAYPQAAFYSYAYPAPPGFAEASVQPAEAFYFEPLGEFLLPYEAVRAAEDPEALVISFLQSTYEAAATLGGWDRSLLEDSPHRAECARKLQTQEKPSKKQKEKITMSIQENTRLIQEYYDSFNAQDMERMKGLLTDDVECHFVSSDFEKTQGKDGFISTVQECFSSFPDMRCRIESQFTTDDCAVVEGVSEGTHEGELKFADWTLPPTGQFVSMNYCEIYRFRDGKISSVHTYADNLGFLHDLGVDIRPSEQRKAG